MTTDLLWVQEEAGKENFGDQRLRNRYEQLLICLFNSPDKSIPGASKGWLETIGAYRFINHHKVASRRILNPHTEATLANPDY